MRELRSPKFEEFKRKKGRTIFLIASLMVLLTSAAAQDAPPASSPAPAETASPAASPTPIPFSDIIAQAENAAATLKEIGAGAAANSATETIERNLPALTDEINARLKETAQTVEGSTSLDDLRTFEADWRTLTRNLPGWKNDLTLRARKLEDDLRRLGELNERWQKTLAELRATETPPEIVARAEEIIRSAAEARRRIVSEQARVVALQNRVAEQQSRGEEALKTISARREALVGQLLVQDSPPIWSGEPWQQSSVVQGVGESFSTQVTGLNGFAVRNRNNLLIHFLVFILLAAVLFYLRRWARPLVEANADLRQSAVIFYLPVSTALVLAILVSSRIYPQTPQILTAIFGGIALVPTIIILRNLLERALYPVLYSLVVFYLVDQARALFEGVPQITRPLFLAEMLGAFLFFWWFYRARAGAPAVAAENDASEKYTPEKRPPEKEAEDAARHGQVFRVVRIAAIVALPFFAVAFLANALGYVNLARLVGDAVLRSAYAAVVLYALVRIIDGLIAFALRFKPLNLLKMARGYAPEIQNRARKILRFLAFALWIVITLETFTLRETVFAQVEALLTAELAIGSLSISAADVLLFFVVIWAAFTLSRFVRFVLEEDVYPRFSLAQGIPYAVSTIINYLILLAGFFFAVGAAGVDLTRITVLVGAFGVGIGFGLQNIFNNFISGLILLFERPVKVGDEIKIGDAGGTVRRIGIRASRIRLWDNSEIIVPNSKLISENVKNWSFSSSSRKRGVEIPVSVAHTADPERVVEILNETARAHPLVAEKPAPQVLIGEIASPTFNFKLRVWTAQADKTSQIARELTLAVSRKFVENDIEAPPVAAPPA